MRFQQGFGILVIGTYVYETKNRTPYQLDDYLRRYAHRHADLYDLAAVVRVECLQIVVDYETLWFELSSMVTRCFWMYACSQTCELLHLVGRDGLAYKIW